VSFTLVAGLAVAVTMAAAPSTRPAPINIGRASLSTQLNRDDIAQIDKHVKYWVDKIVAAKTAEEAYDARDSLLAEYNKYASSRSYQLSFARSTASIAPGGLAQIESTSRVNSIKQLNLAIAMSRMTRLTSVAGLNALIGHDNPGVRYLGWRGLRTVRDQAILRGGQEVKTLFAALTERAKTESSALAAAQIVNTLHVGRISPPGISEADFGRTQNQAFEILVSVLSSACNRLAAGDTSWSRTCETALPALKSFAVIYRKNPNMLRVVVQQSVNIAWATAKAYESTNGKGAPAMVCSSLLQQTEPVIEALTNLKGKYIRTELAKKKMSIEEKIPAVQNAVLEWVEKLRGKGVKKPVFEKPKPKKTDVPTTQPTTRPTTTQPTTKPAP